jgi:hypothetical protein
VSEERIVSQEAGFIAAVRACANEHHVPEAALNRWLALGEADAMAILTIARELRLRTGQLLSALEMLIEIGVREGQGAARVLARNELRNAAMRGGSRPQRASAFIEKLREFRYPRLAQTRAKLEAAVAAMRLPQGLTVVLPKDLGSDELTIRMTARSASEFQKLLEALSARKEELKALIEVLGGSYEV